MPTPNTVAVEALGTRFSDPVCIAGLRLIKIGHAGSGVGDPRWNLMNTDPANRIFTQHVDFQGPEFKVSPVIVLSITVLNTIQGSDERINVYESNVTPAGFDLNVNTWADSRVWACKVTWIAFEGNVETGRPSK